jgi:hypothetical protein
LEGDFFHRRKLIIPYHVIRRRSVAARTRSGPIASPRQRLRQMPLIGVTRIFGVVAAGESVGTRARDRTGGTMPGLEKVPPAVPSQIGNTRGIQSMVS